MKLQCKVEVSRRLPDGSGTSKTKLSNHVLLIGSKPDRSGVFLQLMTQQNPSGKKYLVYKNLSKIFDKFSHEGRATLRFNQTSEDVLITCANPTTLKAFLVILKTAMLKDKVSVPLPSGSKQYKSSELKPPVVKLEIMKREDYPTKFSHQLKHLKIIALRLKRFDSKILLIKNLTYLNLSGNNIEELPTDMSSLTCLVDLELRDNKLEKLTELWPPKLGRLDIEQNRVQWLPKSLFRLKSLKILNASHNEIMALPRNNWMFARSLMLINLEDNCLQDVPIWLVQPGYSADTLNVSANIWNLSYETVPSTACRNPMSLKDLAGRAVIHHKLMVQPGDIPRELFQYLEQSGICFYCRSAVWFSYSNVIVMSNYTQLPFNCYSCVISDRPIVIGAEYCSADCFNKLLHRSFS